MRAGPRRGPALPCRVLPGLMHTVSSTRSGRASRTFAAGGEKRTAYAGRQWLVSVCVDCEPSSTTLGGVGFLAVCGGLLLLTSFIAAPTAFITQLITLAAVIFGGWISVQVVGSGSHRGGTTVHIREATFKRNHFHG
ncbi:hypothetical protein ACFYRD_20485 [Streptomyces hirsutus]|uniref:hypothetical protein n=1 Tax=Streptomyces hirsutus TaxID=35620 RepID=UPI003689C358